MEMFLVYIWSIWDNFGWIVPILMLSAGVSFFMMGVMLISRHDSNSESQYKTYDGLYDQWKTRTVKLFTTTLIVIFLSSFIPSKNQMILIVSAPTIVDVAKNIKDSNASKELQQTPEKLVKTLNLSLDYLNKQIEDDKKGK